MNEKQFTQAVRLFDVIIIAPYLINHSMKKGLDKETKNTLLVFGMGTLLYNGYNFLKNT